MDTGAAASAVNASISPDTSSATRSNHNASREHQAANAAGASSNHASSLHPASHTHEEAQWALKDIYWRGQNCKIITQNENGPCSLIALCNILLLRGDLLITPPDRPVVSYSYLSELIADYLLSRSAQMDQSGLSLEAALSVLPRTQYGLDVDVNFSSYSSFSTTPKNAAESPTRPLASASDGAGELALFTLCGVPLVHGWLPDPADSKTYQAVVDAGSYNRATDLVVRGDEAAAGGVVQDRGVGKLAAALSTSNTESSSNGKGIDRSNWSPEQAQQIRQALVLQNFLDTSSTQLTYHGLFVLAQQLPAGQPVALFRNSHVSVLYKRLPDEGLTGLPEEVAPAPPVLYTLVTDSAFLMEDEIVWESLVDIDGASSEYFDGKLQKATMRQGDYVGRDSANPGFGASNGFQQNEDADFALAMQIHQNEQDRLEQRQARRDRPEPSRNGRRGQRPPNAGASGAFNVQQPPSLDVHVPTEVFTTMRYEPHPDRLQASLNGFNESDALVLGLLPAELRTRYDTLPSAVEALSLHNQQSGTQPPRPTNPFLAASNAGSVQASATNPFVTQNEQSSASRAPAEPREASVVQSHRLFKHVPLLAEHLRRLETSAGAICRAYSMAWSMPVLEQYQALDAFHILDAVESALATEAAKSGPIQEVKGIRVGISKEGRIRATLRSVKPFPSSVAMEETNQLAGKAPLPTVRFDTHPTRVRTMDLEPVVFNKTDARGFYEMAKYRAGADASVLSGVRPEDGRCFDVLMWNDEQTDTMDSQANYANGNHVGQQPNTMRHVTETSIANIVIEYFGDAHRIAQQQPQQQLSSQGGEENSRSRFVTPRTSAGMLDGLMRHWLVEKQLVEEQDVSVDELQRSVNAGDARIWLCNALRGVWQVELVDHMPMPMHPAMPSDHTFVRSSSGQAPGVGPNADGGRKKKNRFSKLIGGGDGSGSQRGSSKADAGASFSPSQANPDSKPAMPTADVHEQVMDDLYGPDKGKSRTGKNKKSGGGKDGKDCVIM